MCWDRREDKSPAGCMNALGAALERFEKSLRVEWVRKPDSREAFTRLILPHSAFLEVSQLGTVDQGGAGPGRWETKGIRGQEGQ